MPHNKKFPTFKPNLNNNSIINSSPNGKTRTNKFKFPIKLNKNLQLWDNSPNITWLSEGTMIFLTKTKISRFAWSLKQSVSTGNYRYARNSRATKIKNGPKSQTVEGGKIIRENSGGQYQTRKEIWTKCRLIEKSRSRSQGPQSGIWKKYPNGLKAKLTPTTVLMYQFILFS